MSRPKGIEQLPPRATGIEQLPPELIHSILDYLDYNEVRACYLASPLFHVLTERQKDRLKYTGAHPGVLIRRGDLYGIRYLDRVLGRRDLFSSDLLKLAIKEERLGIVDYLLGRGASKFSVGIIIDYAAKYGTPLSLKLIYLHRPDRFLGDPYFKYSGADSKSAEVMRTFHFLGANYDRHCTDLVARGGNVPHLQLLLSLGSALPTLNGPSREGHFPMVRYLRSTWNIPITQVAINYAGAFSHLSILKYLYWQTDAHPSSYAINRSECIETIRFLYFIEAPGEPLNHSLRSGHYLLSRLLISLGYTCNRYVINDLVVSGYTALVYLVHRSFPDLFHSFAYLETNPLDCSALYDRKHLTIFLLRIGLRPNASTLNYLSTHRNTELFNLMFAELAKRSARHNIGEGPA